MPRSQGNPHPSLLARVLFFFTKRAIGRVPLGMRIRAFDPKYLRHAARLDMYGAARGTVPMNLKELAQLRVALMVGCPF
jgi:alkylhydroperoxidase family enzyme